MSADQASLRRWAALASLLGGTVVATVNNSMSGVAVPFVAEDLDVGLSTSVWLVTAFSLTGGVLMPLAGRIGDIVGTRRTFLAGAVIMAVASVVAGLAPTMPVLIAARVVQGLGASSVLPCVMATIGRLFPADQRGRGTGLWAAVNSASLAAGPSVGGVVVEGLGWRWMFLLSAPAILVVAGVAWRLVPPDPPARAANPDGRGALLLAAAVAAFVLPVTEGRAWGWTSAPTLLLVAVSAGATALLVRHVRTAAHPFVTPALLRARGFASVSGLAALQMVVLFALTFVVPVYLVLGRGDAAGVAGLVTSSLPVSMLLGALVAGRLADSFDLPRLALAGGSLCALGAGGVALSGTSTIGLVAGLAVAGAGISLIQAPTAAEVTRVAPADQVGIAAGVFNSARFVAGGIGAAVTALVFEVVSGVDPETTASGGAAARAGLRAGAGVGLAAAVAIIALAAVLARGSRLEVSRPSARPRRGPRTGTPVRSRLGARSGRTGGGPTPRPVRRTRRRRGPRGRRASWAGAGATGRAPGGSVPRGRRPGPG
ncbi:MAG TPA: MFS transporter [Iamia sp.]|nr:MFS transporter [Iamia sp.]